MWGVKQYKTISVCRAIVRNTNISCNFESTKHIENAYDRLEKGKRVKNKVDFWAHLYKGS